MTALINKGSGATKHLGKGDNLRVRCEWIFTLLIIHEVFSELVIIGFTHNIKRMLANAQLWKELISNLLWGRGQLPLFCSTVPHPFLHPSIHVSHFSFTCTNTNTRAVVQTFSLTDQMLPQAYY